jgi:hypothetical protein
MIDDQKRSVAATRIACTTGGNVSIQFSKTARRVRRQTF